jgi:citrate lyase subunit beta/citryl-CoA lyase
MSAPRRLGRLRSLLFAPATNAAVVAKLGTRGADAVVIDCEDATPAELKVAARTAARTAVPALTASGVAVTVRVNAPSSGWFADDVTTALAEGVAAVVVPKIERRDELDEVTRLLDAAGLPDVGVIAGIETALGVADARPLLAHPRIVAGYFGAEDFIADMGGRRTPSNAEVASARSFVALAGRLAGVPVLDQVVTDFGDDARFLHESAEAYSMGYAGKLCIHPRQVALANDAFRPSADEIDRARRLLAAYEAAQADGRGAIAFEGQMVDEPLAAQARRIVSLSLPD